MTSTGKELEVKFMIADLSALEQRLQALGAELAQQRVHEVNLRYDTPDESLSRSYQVLRLRKDQTARVTYKGPGTISGGARLRTELEFTVGDFDTARQVFEALGYQVFVMYEKYRATYTLENAEDTLVVTLDEMPYGSFAEIEGPTGKAIQAAAGQLGLRWEARILDSYLVMFDRLKASLHLNFRDLSFENFEGIRVTPEILREKPADLAGA